MPTFNVRIVQGYRVSREITIELEAPTEEAAIDKLDTTNFDTPAFEAGWAESWSLEHE